MALLIAGVLLARPAAALNYAWYHWTHVLQNPGAEDGVLDPWSSTASVTQSTSGPSQNYPLAFNPTSGPTVIGGTQIDGTEGASWFRGGGQFSVPSSDLNVYYATLQLTQTVDIAFLGGLIDTFKGAITYGGDAIEVATGPCPAISVSLEYRIECLDASGSGVLTTDSLAVTVGWPPPGAVLDSRKTVPLPSGVRAIRFTLTAQATYQCKNISVPHICDWRVALDDLHFDVAVFTPIAYPIPMGSHGEAGAVGAAPALVEPTCPGWTAVAGLRTGSRWGAAAVLDEAAGDVLVVGGWDPCRGETADAAIYSGGLGTWSPARSLPEGRCFGTATYLTTGTHAGTVLLLGGHRCSGGCRVVIGTAELYDMDRVRGGVVGSASPPRLARYGHTATRLPDGRVLVAGGRGAGGVEAQRAPFDAEFYSPARDAWEYLPGFLASVGAPALVDHTATVLPDGRVLFLTAREAILFDPVRGTAVRRVGACRGWRRHVASLLPDGGVLVSGEVACGCPSALTMIYQPDANTWECAPAMREPRGFASAVTLPGGQVLVVGGRGVCGRRALSSAELFNPVPPAGLSVDAGPDERAPLTLGSVALVGRPGGGTWSGVGVVGTAFRPSLAGVGTHTVTYTVSCPCGPEASDTRVFTVPAP